MPIISRSTVPCGNWQVNIAQASHICRVLENRHVQRKKNTTILDVAKRAGVSKMTVSRVLNNEFVVKPSTRERIYSAMEALNYRPNGLARSLAGGQSIYVGMLYTNPSYFYLSELLFGALQACRERGHHVLVDEAYTMADLADPNYITKRFFETGVHPVIDAIRANCDALSGYKKDLAAGTICAGGSLGTMIPPSIVVVICSVISRRVLSAK